MADDTVVRSFTVQHVKSTKQELFTYFLTQIRKKIWLPIQSIICCEKNPPFTYMLTYINKTKKAKNQIKILWIWLHQTDGPKTQSQYVELDMFHAEGYMAMMSSTRRSSSEPKHWNPDHPHTRITSSLPGPVCTTPATSLQGKIAIARANPNQLKKSLALSFRQELASSPSFI